LRRCDWFAGAIVAFLEELRGSFYCLETEARNGIEKVTGFSWGGKTVERATLRTQEPSAVPLSVAGCSPALSTVPEVPT
jgi:hypothetical protein